MTVLGANEVIFLALRLGGDAKVLTNQLAGPHLPTTD